jgi:release factor glutamine methyltransferase
VDIDPAAVQCAARNIGSRGTVYQGDLYEPLPSSLAGRFTLIVANAPYVPSGEVSRLPREARLYEPQASLDGGVDGLDIQRRVAAGAYTWLASGGHLLIETSWHQAERTRGVVAAAHLSADVVRSEALEAAVVVGTKRAMRLA